MDGMWRNIVKSKAWPVILWSSACSVGAPPEAESPVSRQAAITYRFTCLLCHMTVGWRKKSAHRDNQSADGCTWLLELCRTAVHAARRPGSAFSDSLLAVALLPSASTSIRPVAAAMDACTRPVLRGTGAVDCRYYSLHFALVALCALHCGPLCNHASRLRCCAHTALTLRLHCACYALQTRVRGNGMGGAGETLTLTTQRRCRIERKCVWQSGCVQHVLGII